MRRRLIWMILVPSAIALSAPAIASACLEPQLYVSPGTAAAGDNISYTIASTDEGAHYEITVEAIDVASGTNSDGRGASGSFTMPDLGNESRTVYAETIVEHDGSTWFDSAKIEYVVPTGSGGDPAGGEPGASTQPETEPATPPDSGQQAPPPTAGPPASDPEGAPDGPTAPADDTENSQGSNQPPAKDPASEPADAKRPVFEGSVSVTADVGAERASAEAATATTASEAGALIDPAAGSEERAAESEVSTSPSTQPERERSDDFLGIPVPDLGEIVGDETTLGPIAIPTAVAIALIALIILGLGGTGWLAFAVRRAGPDPGLLAASATEGLDQATIEAELQEIISEERARRVIPTEPIPHRNGRRSRASSSA
jgi:hypothetical protein